MVQGGSSMYMTKNPCDSQWDNSARKSGFEAIQKKEKERQAAKTQEKYGAWGSNFKNQKNFAEMHHC